MNKYHIAYNDIQIIIDYLLGEASSKNAVRKSVDGLKKSMKQLGYQIPQYHDTRLYRIFPNTTRSTLAELKRKSVFVTSKTNFQSWSESKGKFWDKLEYGVNGDIYVGNEVKEPDVVPGFIRVMTLIPSKNILIKTSDILDFVLLCMQDDFDRLFSRAKGVLVRFAREREVFVDIKDKEIPVLSVWGYERDLMVW